MTAIHAIETKYGRSMVCRGGHGRLQWRAKTFYTEEPETARWLDTIGPDDVYWDVGANVGLYAIYVAMFRTKNVMAFEPESQNYALLVENACLNDAMLAVSPIALCEAPQIGRLKIPALTKGGAYNQFGKDGWQVLFGTSIDDLVFNHGFAPPTCLKIDVDGTEEQIVSGARLAIKGVRSLMIEINGGDAIRRTMRNEGFVVASDVPCARNETARNVIFNRVA